MVIKSVLSLVLFFLTYILLLIFNIALGSSLIYAGFYLMNLAASPIVFLFGLILVVISIPILFLMIRFNFSKRPINESSMIEVDINSEPKLFAIIYEIVKKAGTNFPQKVNLAYDSNAGVLNDVSFWGMFFPSKKNLLIGVGFVNSVTISEFVAVLAHEFGHFSQKSMNIGSYVDNVNRGIYQLLLNNSFIPADPKTQIKYITKFDFLIMKINKSILRKVYKFVNLSYLGLSREMEFHADQVAAKVAGSNAMINYLLRFDLSDNSLLSVINYYFYNKPYPIKTDNVYPQQRFLMDTLGKKYKLPFKNDLPQVSLDYLNRIYKTQIIYDDQWATHPTLKDRVLELKRLNIEPDDVNENPASSLFSNFTERQKELTIKIFSGLKDSKFIRSENFNQFVKNYTDKLNRGSFHPIFNNYFDYENPSKVDPANFTDTHKSYNKSLSELLSDEYVGMTFDAALLESDLKSLESIADGRFKVESFDYDGKRYSRSECHKLIPRLKSKLAALRDVLNKNDMEIFNYFIKLAVKDGSYDSLVSKIQLYLEIDKDYYEKIKIFHKMLDNTSFIQTESKPDVIEDKIEILDDLEMIFKEEIKKVLLSNLYKVVTNSDIRKYFRRYLIRKYTYYLNQEYDEKALDVLFNCINNYEFILSETYFIIKKDLLDYLANLELSKIENN